jgi:hypothetical protein
MAISCEAGARAATHTRCMTTSADLARRLDGSLHLPGDPLLVAGEDRVRAAFGAANDDRLRTGKATYLPANVVRSTHNVPAGARAEREMKRATPAEEHVDRRHIAADSERSKDMNVTPLRAVRLAGLLLVAVCILASPATAKEADRSLPSAVANSSAADVECPCNAGLPKGSVASPASPVACPCNTGLPDGPSGALSAQLAPGSIATAGTVGFSTVSDVQCPCNAGLPVGQASGVRANPVPQAGVANPSANQSSEAFDWADAGVGAAVTAGIGLLLLAGASLFGRHQVRGRLRAS